MSETEVLEFLKAMRSQLSEQIDARAERIEARLTGLISDFRQEVSARFDTIEEHLAGTAAVALEARGIAERLKERMKRFEDRP
jgi:hypothetical protein